MGKSYSQNGIMQECFQDVNRQAAPTGKIPLGRSRPRWEDNIRMDLKEIGINTSNWLDLTQDRDYWRALVKAALKLWVP